MLGLLDGTSVRQGVLHLATTNLTCRDVPSSRTWAVYFPHILRMNTDTVTLQQFRTPCVYTECLIARLGTVALVQLLVVVKKYSVYNCLVSIHNQFLFLSKQ